MRLVNILSLINVPMSFDANAASPDGADTASSDEGGGEVDLTAVKEAERMAKKWEEYSKEERAFDLAVLHNLSDERRPRRQSFVLKSLARHQGLR